MALEDVARLVCPHAPDRALKLLKAFYKEGELSKNELLKASEMNEKIFRYYLTQFRKYRIIRGERTVNGYKYHLSPHAFHARLDTLFVDPLRTLKT